MGPGEFVRGRLDALRWRLSWFNRTPSMGTLSSGAANEFRCERRQSIELSLRPAEFDRHVLALDVAGLGEALAERGHDAHGVVSGPRAHESDHRHCRLLRARSEWVCGDRAA
jgi:hypothetical protein